MQLILAVDFRSGMVVHGTSGNRARYRPLTWGASHSAVPAEFVSAIGPRYLYIADLDRIERTGDNIDAISTCGSLVRTCFVDRGCRSPADLLDGENIINIIGTETAGDDLSIYHGGYVSIDLRNGRVVPSGSDPISALQSARDMAFDGCILLNISSVGTGCGIADQPLGEMRDAYDGPLLYGGGISSVRELEILNETGFNGAIVATGLHRGTIPLDLIREGSFC